MGNGTPNTIYLISTPCSFSWDFHSEYFHIEQTAKNTGDFQHYSHPGPFENHFYFVPIMPQNSVQDTVFFKTDADFVDALTDLSSLYYGKRIKQHGPVFMGGMLLMADLLKIRPNPYYLLPFYAGNHQMPLQVPSDWRILSNISDLILKCSKNVEYARIMKAATAYAESLRIFDVDKEIAYFRLIQSLEVSYSKDVERV